MYVYVFPGVGTIVAESALAPNPTEFFLPGLDLLRVAGAFILNQRAAYTMTSKRHAVSESQRRSSTQKHNTSARGLTEAWLQLA